MGQFSPPPPPTFFWTPLFLFFSCPSNIEMFEFSDIITKIHPPFQNPGSALGITLTSTGSITIQWIAQFVLLPLTVLGRVVQSPIKLTQGYREFWFQFCNFLVRSSVYIVCPSVLSSSDLKLHQTLEVKNIFKQENIMLQLTFNPGLTLIGFRTTRPGIVIYPVDSNIHLCTTQGPVHPIIYK